jgi:rhamnose utilization protein RhaD (predicted bifunctional aldolase and dehydrogenase)
MAIPNYTYLKLKMSGPHGVITIGTSFQRAYECEVECCEHAVVIIASEEPMVIKEGAIEEEPNSKRSARSVEPTEGTKEVLIDPSGSEGKVVRIGTLLSPK